MAVQWCCCWCCGCRHSMPAKAQKGYAWCLSISQVCLLVSCVVLYSKNQPNPQNPVEQGKGGRKGQAAHSFIPLCLSSSPMCSRTTTGTGTATKSNDVEMGLRDPTSSVDSLRSLRVHVPVSPALSDSPLGQRAGGAASASAAAAAPPAATKLYLSVPV